MPVEIPSPQPLNPHVAAMQPSATLAMSARAKARRRAGHDVISLSAGEPDFDTPAPVVEAAHQALREGFTHYTPNAGIPELREAIAEKLRRENGLEVEAAQVLCSNGAKQSVAQAVLALCQPGDEVLIPAPYWVSYPEMARLVGATPVIVETTPESHYTMTPEQLDDAITERTRLLVFNSPSNPTGAVYSPEEMAALAEVLQAHERVFVVSDEIYEYVLFDAVHTTFGALPGMAERTVTVNGFSKGYAMTGWRLGYAAGPQWIISAMAKVQSQFTSAPSSITQKAGLAALAMSREPIEEMVAAFRRRRDFMLDRLAHWPEVDCPKPEGAFYLFPDISSHFGRTASDGTVIGGSEDFAMYLLEQHDVATVAGHAFGADYGLRLSYAASMEDLEKAATRIEAALDGLN
ncbi:MAG: pyridoxal phosphate-dependent aminotransferase [Rhodothermaceae bacterium]|nr:pyridoxal phosphate-dependent aminotransferase [Rhodothermaceae bacterium]